MRARTHPRERSPVLPSTLPPPHGFVSRLFITVASLVWGVGPAQPDALYPLHALDRCVSEQRRALDEFAELARGDGGLAAFLRPYEEVRQQLARLLAHAGHDVTAFGQPSAEMVLLFEVGAGLAGDGCACA